MMIITLTETANGFMVHVRDPEAMAPREKSVFVAVGSLEDAFAAVRSLVPAQPE